MNAVGRLTWRARLVMMVRKMLQLLLLLKKALSRHTPRAGPGLSQAELTRPPGLFSRRGTEPRNSRELRLHLSDQTRPPRHAGGRRNPRRAPPSYRRVA